jgi:hypothetical protein
VGRRAPKHEVQQLRREVLPWATAAVTLRR